ncbi:MAG: RnfABCDGE type electron transport complex subunit D [Pseudomonadota bacterium]
MAFSLSSHPWFRDPRHYQIATLSALLGYGWITGAFEIEAAQFTVIVLAACATQIIGSFLIATRPDLRSALVTSLSLALLLRADAVWPLALAGALAVGSKFALRLNGTHIFNPANFAIVAMTLATGAAWTTPGQWGTAVWFAALLAGAGMFVTYRAARFDVPLIFLGVFAALLIGRALWLGDPLSIPLLRLQNGALILFAFFMISDPKTTPDGALARAIFAGGAALAAYVMTFHFFMADGLFYALALLCILRPLLEWANPAPRYQWGDAVKPPQWKFRMRRSQSSSEPRPRIAPAE